MKINVKAKILIVGIILVMLVSIFQTKSLAADQEIITLQEDTNKYIIYIDGMLNKNFEFSFSQTKEETNLNYINSAKDSDGNSIAYVDEELKNTYFNAEEAYMYVKTEDKVVVSGEKIILSNVITKNDLKSMETLTKNITIEANAEDESIKVKGSENKKYYYNIAAVSSSEEYNRLTSLIDEINKFDAETDPFTKIKSYKELYELYINLVNGVKDDDWIEVKNLEITKPYEAKENQRYVLLLKDSEGNVDVQLLTAYEQEIKNVEEKEVKEKVQVQVEEEESDLPGTYDDMTVLIIALGIIVIAIIALLIVKKAIYKSSK